MVTPSKTPVISANKADRAGKLVRSYLKLPSDQVDMDAVIPAFRTLREWRQTCAYPLSLVTPALRKWVLRESFEGVAGQRLKRTPQIAIKLTRFPTMRLSQMEDIGGCRAVLLNQGEVDAVARHIERWWDVKYRSDYRDDGKPGSGYRALHYVVVRQKRLIEIQLRTQGQHRWSETVERTASRLSFDLKDGQGPPELIQYFRAASDLIALQDIGADVEESLMDEFETLREQVRPYFVRRASRRSG
jgi:putative GTP pyrophosphokinase